MPYVNSKNGFRMYVPQWQMQRGSNMKKMNAAAVGNSLNTQMFGAIADAGAAATNLFTQIAAERVQKQAQDKLAAQRSSILSGLDISA